jgi:hypothetical protein
MNYWEYDGTMNVCPTFPGYVQGTEKTFSLTYVNADEQYEQCYLYVHPQHIGTLYAKREHDAEYVEIMGVFDARCYIGTVQLGSTVVQFMLCNESDDTDSYAIPVMLAHDDGVDLPCVYFYAEWSDFALWQQCWVTDTFWLSSWGETVAEETCSFLWSFGTFLDGDEPQPFEDSDEPGLWV